MWSPASSILYLGREQSTETTLRPKYISAHGAPSLDGQALLVIAALTYARHTDDAAFLQNHWSQLEWAMQWLKSNDKDAGYALLHQGAFADWADSINRSGNILYTNIVYWKALSEMAQAAARLDLVDQEKFYASEAERVSQSIQNELWRSDLGLLCNQPAFTPIEQRG